MFCTQCGCRVEEGLSFCPQCGAKLVKREPTVPAKVENTEKPAKVKKEKAVTKQPGETPKKNLTGLWIALAAVLVLSIVVTVFAVLTFPLEVTISTEGKTKTTTGFIRDLEIAVKSNQPILSVQYEVGTKNSKNLTDTELTGSLLEKTTTIEKMQIPVGKTVLRIHVKTLFGTYTDTVNLQYDFGYTAAPMESAIVYSDNGTKLLDNELLVYFADGVAAKDAKALLETYGAEVVGEIYLMNQYQTRFANSDIYTLETIKAQMEEEEQVVAVTYNTILDTASSLYPNDTEYDSWDTASPAGNNWGLECIDAPGAWEYLNKMQGTKVGVIDSSLMYSHEDLEINSGHYNILPTDDFPTLASLMEYYTEESKTHICSGNGCNFCSMRDHGTHCAGIIGARGNNRKGVSGVNWNADLYFTTFWYNYLNDSGNLGYYDTYNGWMYSVAYMVASGCRVLSISVGSKFPSIVDEEEREIAATYNAMIKKLEDAGYDFLIMKAAGNSGDDASNYSLNRIMTTGEHARAHTVIVGALEHSTNIWGKNVRYSMAGYSNYGELIDVVAPGSYIYSTVFNGYEYMSGTSMATPMAAGVASLLYSVEPNLTYDQVKDILIATNSMNCAKGGRTYPIVNAKLAVEYVLAEGGGNPEPIEPEVGFVTGTIQDAVTSEVIENAGVLVTNSQTNESYEATVVNGVYYLYADPGAYTMTFRADGYQDETIYNVQVTAGVVNYNIRLNMVQENPINGYISGTVLDAFDASRIPYANIKIYKGVNNTSGDPVASIMANEFGYYDAYLEPGNYTLVGSADGYITSQANVLVVGDRSMSNQNCVLTPILNEGEIRVVLTWGEYPSDLDSHLLGPTPDGEQFHVLYKDKNYYYDGQKYVNLDVDDTSSYGPETTSVYIGVEGVYTFYVHDYTNRNSNQSNALATSNAQIKVYIGGSGEYYEFNVPNDDGTIWVVFTIENGVLTPVNTMDYGQDDYIPET